MDGDSTHLMTYRQKRKAAAVLRSLRGGASIIEACRGADITPAMFWLWRKWWPSLQDEATEIIDSRTQVVEDALYKNAAQDGNVAAQIFWLKNRASHRWREKIEHDVAGKVEVVEMVLHFDGRAVPQLSDDELDHGIAIKEAECARAALPPAPGEGAADGAPAGQ